MFCSGIHRCVLNCHANDATCTVESLLKDLSIGHKSAVCQDMWPLVKCRSFWNMRSFKSLRWSVMAVASQDSFSLYISLRISLTGFMDPSAYYFCVLCSLLLQYIYHTCQVTIKTFRSTNLPFLAENC